MGERGKTRENGAPKGGEPKISLFSSLPPINNLLLHLDDGYLMIGSSRRQIGGWVL